MALSQGRRDSEVGQCDGRWSNLLGGISAMGGAGWTSGPWEGRAGSPHSWRWTEVRGPTSQATCPPPLIAECQERPVK